MTGNKSSRSRLTLAAGILLLLIIPVTAIWVFGSAAIAGFYEQSHSLIISAGQSAVDNDPVKTPAGINEDAAIKMRRSKSILHVFLAFMVLAVSLLIKQTDPWSRFAVAPVRFKLVLLVLYAVALPVSGLLFFGGKYLGEYRELLTQEAYLACHSSITELENGFEKEKAWLLKLFRSHKKLPEMLNNPGVLFDKFRAMEAKRIQKWIEVRDINCEVLLTTQAQDVTEKVGVICKAIARLGINRFLTHRLDASRPQKLQAFEVLIQEFFESPLGGWARVFESPDELHSVSFGGFDIFYFWDVFENPAVKPAFMIADQDTRSAVRKYLRESLRERVVYGQDMIRMLAWSLQFKDFMPEEPPESSLLKQFAQQIAKENGPLTTRIHWQDAGWLVAGAPGKTLKNTILMSFYPVEAIDRQIAAVRSDLFWGVFFALVLAVLIGLMFARTMISPVTGLMQGVQALRRRDTSHRLEILQNDELGRLSATFNATSETLQDVLSAKTIQALLIPDRMPEIPGFSGDLVNIAAADLGGDYCDVVPVDASRWLLVIGDVTGHGVSSALVTAMTKAIVSEYAKKPGFELNDMFICLNEMLFTQFKRQKCMTFFAAVLDTADNSLQCISAGHPLPLLFGRNGLKEFPKQGCPPLGFSVSRKVFPQAKMSLDAGDCLVMFTDIFIELHNRSGNPLGSSGFAAICARLIGLPPAEMRSAILEEIKALAGSQFDDDLTMIILKNNNQPN